MSTFERSLFCNQMISIASEQATMIVFYDKVHMNMTVFYQQTDPDLSS